MKAETHQDASPSQRVKPILMSAPMVRALLEGRKTQTRRVVKNVYKLPCHPERFQHNGWAFIQEYNGGVYSWPFPCPYGDPGDLLWVRETAEVDYDTSDAVTLAKYTADNSPVLYSGPEVDERGEPDYGGSHAHWWYSKDACPSIHMPRWASRLTLELTEVRVERLHEISEEDAKAEGIEPFGIGWRAWKGQPPVLHARHAYQDCWKAINGPDAWAVNPWVWVLSFRLHQQNVDALLTRRAA